MRRSGRVLWQSLHRSLEHISEPVGNVMANFVITSRAARDNGSLSLKRLCHDVKLSSLSV